MMKIHFAFVELQQMTRAKYDEFLEKIMNPVKEKLADEEEELLEDEDPFP